MKKVGLFAYGETGLAALQGLLKEFEVVWVILPPEGIDTQDSSAVKKLAEEKEIEILFSNSNSDIHQLISRKLPDAVVISSYNKILSSEILNSTKFINIHHGDLPRWRGRANINWAIILGRKEIGITFHEATVDLDSGNIYYQVMVPIRDDDTVKTVYDKFNRIIENEVATVVKKVLDGDKGVEQEGEGTYCSTRLPEDGLIDWNKTSVEIDRLIRGLTKPYAGAFTYFEGEKLIIWESEIPRGGRIYEARVPGRVAVVDKNKGVEVLTGDGSIVIKSVTYGHTETNASEIIKSVKKTLGINLGQLYEEVQKLLKQK